MTENSIIKIEDFEDKTTQKGKAYCRYKTSAGWMSCFDGNSNAELKKNCGNNVKVKLKTSGEFTNIDKFLSVAEEENEEVETERPAEKTAKKTQASNKEMYVSYTKDAFCAIVTRISQSKFDGMTNDEVLGLMDIAIQAIDKAKNHYQ